MPRLDPQLKEILVCPHCHGELEELEDRPLLRCLNCGLGFSIADGFPNMLIDEAEQPEGFSLDATADDATADDATADDATADDATVDSATVNLEPTDVAAARQHDAVSTSNSSSDAQDAA